MSHCAVREKQCGRTALLTGVKLNFVCIWVEGALGFTAGNGANTGSRVQTNKIRLVYLAFDQHAAFNIEIEN